MINMNLILKDINKDRNRLYQIDWHNKNSPRRNKVILIRLLSFSNQELLNLRCLNLNND